MHFWPPPEPKGGWALPPGVSFSAPAGMAEDEAMRNAKRTGIEQYRHDTELSPQDPLPCFDREILTRHAD